MVYSIVMADELYLKSPEAQLESPADTIHSYLIATTMITADSNIKGLLWYDMINNYTKKSVLKGQSNSML